MSRELTVEMLIEVLQAFDPKLPVVVPENYYSSEVRPLTAKMVTRRRVERDAEEDPAYRAALDEWLKTPAGTPVPPRPDLPEKEVIHIEGGGI